ncbi:MAG: hypothetical protein L0H25_05275 [Micrococcales bacterium]|nr:hypothetical protein [Micrococcales bacterium]
MSDRVLSIALAAEEAKFELPMPVIAYFFIVFAMFLAALAVTWSFRNTAHKLPAPHHDAASQHPQIEPGEAKR